MQVTVGNRNSMSDGGGSSSRLLALTLLACALAATAAAPITKVTVVFACHLDVGFHSPAYPEPGLDNNVLGHYFNDHYPAAIRLAQQFRERNSTERFVWLTHSWVVSLFLDCPTHIGLKCPNATTVEHFKAAVRRGDIVWHAMPHNAQVDLYDVDLLQFGVQLSHDLDRSFGLPPKMTASQRDVPGLTRAAVPLLAYQGVKAISVGVNPGSAPPGVPHNRPFWWRDPPSGQQLLAFWHPGGYSGVPVDSRQQCVQVDGLDHALCLAWTGDNAGPPSMEEALDIFLRVRSSFPSAEVQAGGFDGFVSDVLAAAPTLDLPVVTAEIADTWIYGVASDPGKLSEYRALLRMRRASAKRYDDPAFKRFSRLLLKLPEHTWGVDIKEYPGEFLSWSNADLHKRLANMPADDPFQVAINSWVRQRSYSQWALQELGDSAAGQAGWEALAQLRDGKAVPNPGAANSGFQSINLAEAEAGQPLLLGSGSWQLELCRKTGAIVGLRFGGSSEGSGTSGTTGGPVMDVTAAKAVSLWGSLTSKLQLPASLFKAAVDAVWGQQPQEQQAQQQWASLDAPLALPVYSTYSEDDYNVIWDTYAYMGRPQSENDWFYRDFGKPNATVRGGARRADYFPSVEEVWWRPAGTGGLLVVIKAAFEEEAVRQAGAPQALWTEIRAPAGSRNLSVEVTWQDKTPTRLPEALWLRWMPRVDTVDPSSWLLYKLGQPISPLEVVLNGSQSLHAVGDEGVSVDSADGGTRLYIRSLDAALVSPGHPRVLPVVRQKPDLTQGVSFCLVNNMWGTNYPSWVPFQEGDANMRFRFVLELEELSSSSSSSGQAGRGGADVEIATMQ